MQSYDEFGQDVPAVSYVSTRAEWPGWWEFCFERETYELKQAVAQRQVGCAKLEKALRKMEPQYVEKQHALAKLEARTQVIMGALVPYMRERGLAPASMMADAKCAVEYKKLRELADAVVLLRSELEAHEKDRASLQAMIRSHRSFQRELEGALEKRETRDVLVGMTAGIPMHALVRRAIATNAKFEAQAQSVQTDEFTEMIRDARPEAEERTSHADDMLAAMFQTAFTPPAAAVVGLKP